MFKKILFATIYLLFLIALPSVSLAYDKQIMSDAKINNSFSVGPGKIELELKAGEVTTKEIKVLNQKNSKANFKIEYKDIGPSQYDGSGVFFDGNSKTPRSIRDYISFGEDEFTLESREQVILPVKIAIPAEISGNSFYGSLIISEKKDNNNLKNSSVLPRSQVAVLLFVKSASAGLLVGSGHLESMTLDDNFYLSYPFKVKINYNNDGPTYLNPYGYISIKNIFNKEVANVKIDPFYVFPESQRIIVKDLSLDKKMFGKYYAELLINNGYDDQWEKKSFAFYFFDPFFIVLIIALVCSSILIITFHQLFSRTKEKRHIKKVKKEIK